MRAYKLLFGLGFSLAVCAGVFLLSSAATSPAPGKLIPREALITWRGPEGPDRSSAKARFEVENHGGTPVHILSTESGCGCAEPAVNPSIIPPRGRATVDVTARYFPVGERRVAITLNTDSPITPQVVLQLHLIGSRRPPFFLKADADLSYMGNFDPAETREIVVLTVESGRREKVPLFAGVPPFLQVELSRVEEKPYTTPGTVERIYHFKVSFASPPPRELFDDEISVVDPWDGKNAWQLRVLAQFNPSARVVPPLVVLRPGVGGADTGKARFVVVANEVMEGLRVEAGPGEPSPLLVTPIEAPRPTRTAAFEVRVKPGQGPKAGAEYGVVLTWSPDHRITVPVVLKAEASQ